MKMRIKNKNFIYPLDMPNIMRNVFTGFLFITILQKIFDSNQFENLTKTLTNIIKLLIDLQSPGILYKYVFIFIIFIEVFVIVSLYLKKTFSFAVFIGKIFLTLGILASTLSMYFGLNNACGCGLFGENPYIIFSQKIILLLLLIYIRRNKKYYFNDKLHLNNRIDNEQKKNFLNI